MLFGKILAYLHTYEHYCNFRMFLDLSAKEVMHVSFIGQQLVNVKRTGMIKTIS